MNIELRDNPLKGIELGPKMQACSEKERVFAFAWGAMIAESATDAARLAGYADNNKGTKVTASRLLHRPRVIEAIEEVGRTAFRGLLPLVIAGLRRIAGDPTHPDHGKVLLSMASRLGYGEKASVDVNVTGEVVVSHTDAAVEDLRRLKEIGVPREKLIETFGFSGLTRYEAMLSSRVKTIEHKPDELPAGSVDQHVNPMNTP